MKSEIDYVVESLADRKAGEYFAAEFERGGRKRLLQKFASEAILADLQAWMKMMLDKDYQPDSIFMSGEAYRLFSHKYASGGRVGRANYSQLRQYQRQARLSMYAPYGVPFTYAKETMLDNLTRPFRRWWKTVSTPARTIYVDIETVDGHVYSKSSPTGRNMAARFEDMLRSQRASIRRVMESPPGSLLNADLSKMEERVMAAYWGGYGGASWGGAESVMRQFGQALNTGALAVDELNRSLRRVWPTTEHWGSRRKVPFAGPVVWLHNVVPEKDGTRYVFRSLFILGWHFEWNSHFMGDA